MPMPRCREPPARDDGRDRRLQRGDERAGPRGCPDHPGRRSHAAGAGADHPFVGTALRRTGGRPQSRGTSPLHPGAVHDAAPDAGRDVAGHPAVEAAALVKAAQSRSAEPLIAAFTEAAHSLDPSGIEQVLDTARQALGLGRTVDEVLLPAMREIGVWWETGRCDVGHEHLATQTSQAWLARVAPSRPRSGDTSPCC